MSINSNKGVIPIKPELDKFISIANTEPDSTDTKIWIDEGEEVEVATYEELNNIVEISNTQPTSDTNKIWFKDSEQEVEVPTIQELNAVNARIDNIISENVLGTTNHGEVIIAGKKIIFHDNGAVTWENI